VVIHETQRDAIGDRLGLLFHHPRLDNDLLDDLFLALDDNGLLDHLFDGLVDDLRLASGEQGSCCSQAYVLEHLTTRYLFHQSSS